MSLFRIRPKPQSSTVVSAIASRPILAGQAVAYDAEGSIVPAKVLNSLAAKLVRFAGRVLRSNKLRNFGIPKVCGIAMRSAVVGEAIEVAGQCGHIMVRLQNNLPAKQQ